MKRALPVGVVLLTALRPAVLLFAAIFLTIQLFPESFSPFRLAVLVHPKNMEPLVLPACAVIGVAVASMRRRAAVVAPAVVAATNLLLCGVLKRDNAYRLDGAKSAFAVVDGPCVTDSRPVHRYRLWSDREMDIRDFKHAPEPGTWVVLNEYWMEFMQERVDAGEWEVVLGQTSPGRRRLRSMLFGESETAGYTTPVYRVR